MATNTFGSLGTVKSSTNSLVQYRFVKYDGSYAATTDIPIGVLQEPTPADASTTAVAVQVATRCNFKLKVTAGEAISAGAKVYLGSNGKVQDTTDTNTFVGVAAEAAGADGDIIEIFPSF